MLVPIHISHDDSGDPDFVGAFYENGIVYEGFGPRQSEYDAESLPMETITDVMGTLGMDRWPYKKDCIVYKFTTATWAIYLIDHKDIER